MFTHQVPGNLAMWKKTYINGIKGWNELQHNNGVNINIPLISVGWLTGQKLSKEATELTQTLEQTDLIDIYRIFLPSDAEYNFFYQHMEPSPELIDLYAANKTSSNFKRSNYTRQLLRPSWSETTETNSITSVCLTDDVQMLMIEQLDAE